MKFLRIILRKGLLVSFTVFCACASYGQTNVYSVSVYSGGVSHRTGWTVGSPPWQFGLQEYSYRTDTNGLIVSFPGMVPKPGDKYHVRTRIILGPVSFSVPLSRSMTALASGTMILIAGFLLPRGIVRARNRGKIQEG